jgi:hypothetical protein
VNYNEDLNIKYPSKKIGDRFKKLPNNVLFMGGYGYEDENRKPILRMFGSRNYWDFSLLDMKIRTKRMTTLQIFDYDLEKNELIGEPKEFLKTLENC